MPIRQKSRQARLSVTSAQRVSKPSRYLKRKNIIRRYVSIGIEGLPIAGWKNGTKGSKNTGSSSKRATRSSAGGRRKNSAGRIASQRVFWGSSLVRSNDGSNLFAKGTGAIVASFGPDREHPANTNALVTDDFPIDYFRGK